MKTPATPVSWSIALLSAVALLALLPVEVAGQGGPGKSPRYRLRYSTYLGGAAWDQAREAIVYPDGSVLVGAQTASAGLPTTEGAIQAAYAGDDPGLGHGGVYGGDCYLARIAPDGKSIVAATYFGGSRQERNVYGMALDADGNVVFTTMTRSTDAPTTADAFRPTHGGGASDMLVAKISGDLRRTIWCTYIGGKGDDSPRGGLALDPRGNVCVVGTTTSSDFPTTPGVVQRELRGPRDSAILTLSSDGRDLILGTFLGGSGADDAIMGVRFDADGAMHVAGHTKSADFPVTGDAAQTAFGGKSDVYIARLSPDASRILHATYLGGSGNEFAEHRPWLEPNGVLLLSGFTASPDFPTTQRAPQRTLAGSGDGFLCRLSSNGRTFLLSSCLGGSGGENWLMPTVDADGKIYIVGNTDSPDFPVTPDAIQGRHAGGQDAALVVLDPYGSEILHATYLGGSGDEMIRSIALGPGGDLYLVGSTSSPDFPVTEGAIQRTHGGKGDAFVVRLEGLPRFPAGEPVPLLEGRELGRWRPFRDEEFPTIFGEVRIEEDSVVLEPGGPMTGITWTGNIPRNDYEVTLEGKRLEGGDFFCGLTFPVADSHLTLILGGWGGTTVGLSNIDGLSAIENETTSFVDFEEDRWYRIRLRVTSDRIEAWIDDEKKIDLAPAGKRFDIWPQQEPGKPLGITSYVTRAALRKIAVRRLGDAT